MVVKKDGRREPFDAAKIVEGMAKACEKRPIERGQLEEAVGEIERVLRDELRDEVTAVEIGQVVMRKLREMDEVAYVRFASVYKEFGDAESFLREVEDLAKGEDGRDREPGPAAEEAVTTQQ